MAQEWYTLMISVMAQKYYNSTKFLLIWYGMAHLNVTAQNFYIYGMIQDTLI